jgi:hypothetical protein
MVGEPEQRSFLQVLWVVFNRPLMVLLVGAALVTIPVKLYTDRQADLADRASRRAILGKLLTEYQHRISELAAADGELDPTLGKAPGVHPNPRFDVTPISHPAITRVRG